MTVSTVMQLQKHQPGSRRFTILVGDSQGQQHIAVMAGQMLAGEVWLQLRITYGASSWDTVPRNRPCAKRKSAT